MGTDTLKDHTPQPSTPIKHAGSKHINTKNRRIEEDEHEKRRR
jgi:hypothetical protein